MTTLSNLPNEVINIILSYNGISIQDIVNVSTTCKRLYDAVEQSGNTFWQRKLFQRWPRLKRICEEEIRQKHTAIRIHNMHIDEHIDFKELVKTPTKCKKRLRDYLTQMNKQWFFLYTCKECYEQYAREYIFRNSYEIKDNFLYVNMEDIHFMIDQNDEIYSVNYYFLMDELTNLLKQSQSGHNFDELTNIFYGKKLLPYLKRYHLRKVWQKFINRPAWQQLLLEEAAVFVIQWHRPEEDISYSHIETELDNFAYQAMEFLRTENPRHPIFSVSHEQLSVWKYNNIYRNQWDEEDERQILNILCKVLENKIHYIVSQAIIFHGVARRLGVCCNLIYNPYDMFPPHPILVWKPKNNIRNYNYKYDQFFWINALHYELMPMDQRVSYIITLQWMESSRTCYRLESIQFINILIYHMYMKIKCDDYIHEDIQKRGLLELQVLIEPNNMQKIWQLYGAYYTQSIDLSPIIIPLKKIIDDEIGFKETNSAKMLLDDILKKQEKTSKVLDEIRYAERKPKRRMREMEFAVGMIVTIENREIGVIIGWEEQSPETLLARFSWSYTVCCKNGILYRIGQDKLAKTVISDNDPIHRIKNIGKYFCKFNGSYYMPNEMMKKVYEEDVLFLINNF